MDQASKRRSRPSPDAVNIKPIAFNLEEALAVEDTYRPNLLDVLEDVQPQEVTTSARDDAVHILRFIRIWYDVPHQVFFHASTYLDLFLSRIKVQNRYLACLTIACFYCAAEKHGYHIDASNLVKVSECRCSVKDMLRMVGKVKEKLNLETNENDRTTTSAEFLLIFLEIMEYISTRWKIRLQASEVLLPERLLTRLGVLLINSSCTTFRSSTLALALIKFELEKFLDQAVNTESMYFVSELIQLLGVIHELQFTCQITYADLMNCYNNASNILNCYDNRHRTISHHAVQRYLSGDRGNRNRCIQRLDTIEERNQKSP